MTENRLVIGLDFGTTYSGVAYCDTVKDVGDISSVQIVTDWPGLNTGNTEKVPSRISYGPPPEVEVKWGNQIRPIDKAKPHALMKLKLDEKLKKSPQLRLLLAFLTSNFDGLSLDDDGSDDEDGPPEYPGKSPLEIVSDYLSHVRKHVWQVLEIQYGRDLFSTLRKELVVTVPAVWSERAKDQTLKAVNQAKWEAEKISLVTEPEAAAIYTLKWMVQGANKDEVAMGDNFVLCDSGGGTVDLISYKVTQTDPIFKIEEAAVGSGDKCGATYVDREFLSWLKSWIGADAYGKIPDSKLRHGSKFMNEFELAKFNFSGQEEGMEVPLPKECGIEEDESKNIDDRMLTLTPAQMQKFFDPCVNRTLELIDGQIASILKSGKKKPKMILLVGGFGRNAYLRKKITEYGNERGIVTRTPSFPWSAVVRGAVCRGLEGAQSGLVEVRLARKHYGTYASELFNPRIHDVADRYIDKYTNRPFAKGQMTWLVDKGERLPESSPKTASISCSANFRADEERLFGAVLVGCDEDDAPRRYADDGAHNICRAVADLSSVPLWKFTKARTGLSGEEYYIAEFKLQATFVGGRIDWNFVFDGQSYASVSVSYDS